MVQVRKLKLQMQMSADGFVGGEKQTGPGYFNWDDEIRQYSIANVANVDRILLGRKTAIGFIPHWKAVAANSKDADFEFGKKVTNTPKTVFSRTLGKSEWQNATLANGDLTASVNELKSQMGKDLIVYGGSSFVASLIARDLVDEYHLLVNPIFLGRGQTIFNQLTEALRLRLVTSTGFSCGTVLLGYESVKD